MIFPRQACFWTWASASKTVITLTAVSKLVYEEFAVNRVLVIAPKRVAEDTWTTEAEKWDHLSGLRISRVLGSRNERLAALRAPADVYVINRENVVWLTEQFPKGWPFDMVVIDELSSFKSSHAKRFRALRKIRPLVRRLVGLTGTPAPNGLMDLWAQMYLIDMGERLERTVTQYRNRYFFPGKTNGRIVYSYELKQGAEETIKKKISDICVSMKAEDYLQMPELTTNDIPVRLDPEEMGLYRQMEKSHLLELGNKDISALNAAAVGNKLLQIANGGAYTDDGSVTEIHGRKLDALEEILDTSAGQPILVFYTFRHDYARLVERFRDRRPQTLHGQEDIKAWNDGKISLLLAQPASMGHGLNLQAGGHIIVWFGLTWSCEIYQQATARLYRQGQRHGVIVHRLIAKGTIDEQVAKALERKDRTQEALMGALKARLEAIR